MSWAVFFLALLVNTAKGAPESADAVPRLQLHEFSFSAAGVYANPYLELEAEVTLVAPDGGARRRAPLFWDGGQTWRFRFAPDVIGTWRWSVHSADRGLDGRAGTFECVLSNCRGSIQPLAGAPHHFQYQNGERLWFLGDTAWAYAVDNPDEGHDRAAVERYIVNRARQGFNAIHLMLLSEVGWGNRGGRPWASIADETLNPAYFREVDERIAFANAHGLVTGLAIAWGFKGRSEPYAWSRLPSLAARERYARYVTARYAAYDVYFLVSGEWNTEIRWRPAPESAIQREFVRLGDVMRAADPQHRMIGIHPSVADGGSTRAFNALSSWMDFADYQQNYTRLHDSVLHSRAVEKPVVNAEYAYWLRDADGDGQVDKAHSYTLDDIRAATWDIVMAGGYVVAGFGSTYLGGARHVTKFLPDDPKNVPWLEQLEQVKIFFTALDYWKLAPHDELVACHAARTADRATRVETGDVHLTKTQAPAVAYWCLAEPGKTYALYVRGTTEPVALTLEAKDVSSWRAEQFDPRTGARQPLPMALTGEGRFVFRPPDAQDWLVVLRRVLQR